ncbi:hypothetical protein [Mongoliitalea lutea]|uniref:Uncharacterized protein n=1 Tax=Mongoliitalea lutea TaxID=849756 RepID=A0A8J3G6Z8_9BACT|nr:hypothetical protein [Mongoliitalea lutea]GHB49235.1 hypothetical protein GCM10008106_32550 [Mongoliitalea lutea]
MKLTYDLIPLFPLLKHEDFQQATHIYISTYEIDMEFIHEFLSDLPQGVQLVIQMEIWNPEIETSLLNKVGGSSEKLFLFHKPLHSHSKQILIATPEFKLSLITTSNLTMFGMQDEFQSHELYTNEETFENLRRVLVNN